MKSAGKARNNGLYRHIRTSKEIIRNLLNDSFNSIISKKYYLKKYIFKIMIKIIILIILPIDRNWLSYYGRW